jgi:DNA-directed RNA polymerase subunit E'/Rpb7
MSDKIKIPILIKVVRPKQVTDNNKKVNNKKVNNKKVKSIIENENKEIIGEKNKEDNINDNENKNKNKNEEKDNINDNENEMKNENEKEIGNQIKREKVIERKKNSIPNIYVKSLLTTKISLEINEISGDIKEILLEKLVSKISNRCIEEGFVAKNGIKIIGYSSGTILNNIMFEVMYECNISHPVEGMPICGTVKNITKAGIHAQVIDNDKTIPITIFIAREHDAENSQFQKVKEGNTIVAKVIGIRYELNDPYICVIATIENNLFYELEK